jgi:hypothetical protein
MIRQYVAPAARVTGFAERPSGKQGYSGATVRIYDVDVVDNGSHSILPLVTKEVGSVERETLAVLGEQSHPNVPYSYSLNWYDDDQALLCMQYIGNEGGAVQAPVAARAAVGLARIHARNLGRGAALHWLPRADHAYVNGGFILENWRDTWALTLQDEEFAAAYGEFTAPLRGAAEQFLASMDELWEAGDSLTLVHGDLHAGNVLIEGGTPYFVDWEQARYGTLYFDLPNYFTLEQSLVYRDAFEELGYALPLESFMRHYAETARMIGFKYMGFWLERWRRGGADRLQSRDIITSLINTAINGHSVT